MKRVGIILVLGALALLGGCRSVGEVSSFGFEADEYSLAFDATRQALRDARFEIERVDARAGVITTKQRATAGLASPWDSEQTTLKQEWSDLLNQHRRVVRVSFEASDSGGASGEMGDARDSVGPMVGVVEVVVYRRTRPGWRPETESVRLSTRTRDTSGDASSRSQLVPIDRDELLAARLAAHIQRLLEQARVEASG